MLPDTPASRSLPIILVLACAVSGCLGPRRSDYNTAQAMGVADSSEEADRAWEAVQETLRRRGFRLDRVDRGAGIVTTFPVMSQHFFEVWRHDVNTAPDFWESSLNPMRRWVEVRVARGDDETWREIAVNVHKERLSSPDRQFNSTGAAFQYFGDTLPSTTGKPRVTAEDDRWLDRGRDPAMEEYLLRAILGRAGVSTPPGGESSSRETTSGPDAATGTQSETGARGAADTAAASKSP